MVSPEGGVLRQHHSAALLLAPETTEATANAKRAATEANVTARLFDRSQSRSKIENARLREIHGMGTECFSNTSLSLTLEWANPSRSTCHANSPNQTDCANAATLCIFLDSRSRPPKGRLEFESSIAICSGHRPRECYSASNGAQPDNKREPKRLQFA